VKVGRKWRLWLPADDEEGGDGRRDVPEAAGRRGGGDNIGVLLRGRRKTTWSGGSIGEAGVDHAAHEVQGGVYVLTKEEGGRHTPFFNGTGRSSTCGRRT